MSRLSSSVRRRMREEKSVLSVCVREGYVIVIRAAADPLSCRPHLLVLLVILSSVCHALSSLCVYVSLMKPKGEEKKEGRESSSFFRKISPLFISLDVIYQSQEGKKKSEEGKERSRGETQE